MKTTLEITDQILFYLVSHKSSKELCIKDYIITCQKSRCHIRNNLAFKGVIHSYALFSRAVKSKLTETDEEQKYFWNVILI